MHNDIYLLQIEKQQNDTQSEDCADRNTQKHLQIGPVALSVNSQSAKLDGQQLVAVRQSIVRPSKVDQFINSQPVSDAVTQSRKIANQSSGQSLQIGSSPF